MLGHRLFDRTTRGVTLTLPASAEHDRKGA
jgi:DNA-binding transcriptional LysR family regulator